MAVITGDLEELKSHEVADMLIVLRLTKKVFPERHGKQKEGRGEQRKRKILKLRLDRKDKNIEENHPRHIQEKICVLSNIIIEQHLCAHFNIHATTGEDNII